MKYKGKLKIKVLFTDFSPSALVCCNASCQERLILKIGNKYITATKQVYALFTYVLLFSP